LIDGSAPANAPVDLGGAGRTSSTPAAAPVTTPGSAAVQGLNPAVAGRSANAAGSANDEARREYEAAYALVQQKQYDQAEAGLRRFIQSHPRDRLAADATFWLGESFLQRNRPREAAEQFLKISTEYGRSAKAPDAMLKLGISLGAIGARDQACATFAELGRKYPQASASLKQGVERESRKARCAA
jgi:tol-pal system protein YbgF